MDVSKRTINTVDQHNGNHSSVPNSISSSVTSSPQFIKDRPHASPIQKLKTINSLRFNALNNKVNQLNGANNELNDDKRPVLSKRCAAPVIVPMNGNGLNKVICDNNGQVNKMSETDESNKTSNQNRSNQPPNSLDLPMVAPSPIPPRLQSFSRNQYNTSKWVKSCDDGEGGQKVSPPSSGSGCLPRTGSFIFSDNGSQISAKPFSDAASIRSLASIGMGSTDGKKMVIRRVPTSPSELLNIINPPTPPEEDSYDGDSYAGATDDADSLYLKPRRQQWASKLQFVLACVGYSVGLGNVWRFPYLCYKSGGGVFLVPYFITLIICGIPMLYMELAVGQFTGRGPIGAVGHLCPIFKGAGLASVVISFLMSTYYSVIIAYAIYYFFTAFRGDGSWSDCSNRWNTADCWVPDNIIHNITKPYASKTPPEEFFNEKLLQISGGIEEPGSLRWDVVACLFTAWVVVYFALWKSIKSSAKVRYITCTLPFILIVMFLLRSLTLEGANRGLKYFLKPRWELLLDAKVWVNAAAQNFNSLGITFGSMIMFASYNKYNNTILHDVLSVSIVNAVTSLLVGLFAFATIGNIATELNMPISDVIDDGPGLIFVVYPQAIKQMPAAQFWAVLFFFMLLCLGLNTQFAIVEVVVTSIQDGFPKWIKKHLLCHEMLVLIICVISFLFGLPNVTRGGIYFFQLIDHYTASISIMCLAFFEIIAISWFYGVWRLSRDIEDMTGRPPSLYFRVCWLILIPLLLLFLWVFALIGYKPPTYDNGHYHYPNWAIVIGWIISSLSLGCIPLFAVIIFLKSEGKTWKEKLKKAMRPDIYECKICGENNCEHIDKDQEETTGEISPMLTIKILTPDVQEESKTQAENNGAIRHQKR